MEKREVKRVLHFVDTLSVGSGMMGVIMNYYRHIDRTCIQFDFLYFFEEGASYETEILQLGGKVYRIPRPGLNKQYYSEMEAFFHEHGREYIALHCHPIFGAAVMGQLARKNGIRHVIQHGHCSKFSDNPKSAPRNFLMQLTMGHRATEFIGCTDAALRVLLWAKESNSMLLPNAIECEKFAFSDEMRRKMREELDISEQTKLIGHVGRFAPPKNHMFLLDVFGAYHELRPDSKLLLIGSGDLMDAVKNKCREMGLEHVVIFYGQSNRIAELLAAMDIFLFPSIFEGFPVSALEAQASGLPCMISDAVTASAVLSDASVHMSLADSADAWAKRMLTLSAENREEQYLYVTKCGFDIVQNTDLLQQFYLNLA